MIRWVFETLNIGAVCRDFRHGASQYHITSCCYHYSANLVFGVKPGLPHHWELMHDLKMVRNSSWSTLYESRQSTLIMLWTTNTGFPLKHTFGVGFSQIFELGGGIQGWGWWVGPCHFEAVLWSERQGVRLAHQPVFWIQTANLVLDVYNLDANHTTK